MTFFAFVFCAFREEIYKEPDLKEKAKGHKKYPQSG